MVDSAGTCTSDLQVQARPAAKRCEGRARAAGVSVLHAREGGLLTCMLLLHVLTPLLAKGSEALPRQCALTLRRVGDGKLGHRAVNEGVLRARLQKAVLVGADAEAEAVVATAVMVAAVVAVVAAARAAPWAAVVAARVVAAVATTGGVDGHGNGEGGGGGGSGGGDERGDDGGGKNGGGGGGDGGGGDGKRGGGGGDGGDIGQWPWRLWRWRRRPRWRAAAAQRSGRLRRRWP